MRSKLICLLLALCLVLSLSACRKTDRKDHAAESDSPVEDTAESAKDTARSFSRTMTDDFDRMMDNARVRDRDGILTDGENPTDNMLR